jgi:GT2 family glycosyltransferase
MIFVGFPCLNRFDLLQRAVACIDVPADVYIIDNSVKNRGVAASWNSIMREGFGRGYEWVFLANNDCFVAPGTPQKAIDVLGTDGVGIWFICSGAFFAISRATVERVGWFDERFYPAYYEDCDYYRRCDLAGVKRENVPGASAEHLNSMALKSGAKFPDLRPYYIEKWGGPPGEERFTVPFNYKPPEPRQCRRREAAGRRR